MTNTEIESCSTQYLMTLAEVIIDAAAVAAIQDELQYRGVRMTTLGWAVVR